MSTPDYVLYLVPGQEKPVARALTLSPGVRCYCPLRFELKRPRHAKLMKGQHVVSASPFFPGYIFVGFEDQPRWDLIDLTPGIMGVISAHGAPLSISKVELDRVRELEASEKRNMLGKYTQDPLSFNLDLLVPGKMVEITDGPFAGQRAPIISSSKNRSEITVMAALFGRDAPIQLAPHQLRPAT